MTDDIRKCRDKRWYRTVNSMFAHIDGNPGHHMNGGITGLAYMHCLGSMANHSKDDNAEYEEILNTVTPRAYLELLHENEEECGQWPCTVLRATKDIFPDQQILCDYEPTTAGKMWIIFRNETLFTFLAALGGLKPRAI